MLRTDHCAAPHSPLEAYLGEIHGTPLLDPEGEQELAYRVQDGDAEARDHLVRANLRLVVNIARGYLGKGLDLPDLIAEGNLGLLRAVEAFDPSAGTRFSTYASYWIRQSIRRGLNAAKPVRLPTYMTQLVADWRRAAARLEDELGRPPTEEEVADQLNLSVKKLRLIRKALRISSAGCQGTGEGDSLDELLTDNPAASPVAALTQGEDVQQVLHLVEKLAPREAAVVRLRFGLSGEEPLTLKEIGGRLGLTRERVRQIERMALDKLGEGLGAA
jgi:RNA polymerase primary sigma factor